MIIAATLLTDRKPAFPVSLEYLVSEPLVTRIYVNIETCDKESYAPVLDFLDQSGKPYNVDFWWVESDWLGRPQYDQDPARFIPIVRGRDMALDWAVSLSMGMPITHLLFVDSDVRPHPGGLQKLLDLRKPLCGGLVPGRGPHRNVNYVFGRKGQDGKVIRCEHGTSGYLLIERKIFEIQRFRWGPCAYKREVILCDDPAYTTDAFFHQLTDAFYIHTDATADHVDDPKMPLTLETAIRDYYNP